MSLVVMKFGGTSLADITRIKAVAIRVKRELSKNNSVIVVVSAMAGTTNKLIKLVNDIDPSYSVSEYDTVISSGEQITAGLLSISLKTIGIKSQSFLGWQLPIITDNFHAKASIEEVQTMSERVANIAVRRFIQ